MLERLSVFAIFRSAWFSAALVVLVLSIVVCTLDRTPRLWRGVRDIRVAQPEPFFDPRLPDRAAMDSVPAESVRTVLRKSGFHVREATDAAGTRFLYGDRHQYTKLATLLTHLGLILFLVAAAVTSRLGEEQGLVVGEGETLTVQPIGTPDLLLVRNLDFEAPGPRHRSGRPTSRPTSRSSRTAARSRARRSGSTTRCPSPATRSTRTATDRRPPSSSATTPGRPLWDGTVPLTDSVDGLPVRRPRRARVATSASRCSSGG